MRKILIILIIITLLISIVVGCTGENSNIVNTDDQSPLTMYVNEYDGSMIYHIENYNKEIEFGNIEGLPIEVIEYTYEDSEIIFNEISNNFLINQGPDLIYIDYLFSNYMDINKVAEQHIFYDLENMVKKSEIFQNNELNNKVLDAGIINDNRCFIPISYKVPYFISTTKNIENMYNKQIDYLQFEDIYKVIETINSNSYLIPDLFSLYQYQFIDLTNDESYIKDIEIFKEFFEYYKIEYNKVLKSMESLGGDLFKYLCDETYMFMGSDGLSCNCGDFHIIYWLYEEIKLCGLEPVLLNMPTDDNVINLHIDKAVAINNNSNKKEAAFKFIEYMLSETVQVNEIESIAIPVNNNAYKIRKQNFLDNSYDEPYKEPIDEKFAQKFLDMIESAEPIPMQHSIYYIMQNVITPIDDFLNGKISIDEAILQIESRMKLYLSE